MINVIFLGAPGAGKGTQAQILSEILSIPRLSTSEILRQEIAKGGEEGVKIKNIMDSGQFVSDEIMNGLIRKRLMQKDIDQGFIFDGYPRTIAQAEVLQKVLEDNGYLAETTVLNLSVREPELIKRFCGRFTCSSCGYSYHKELNLPKIEGVCDKCGGKDFIIRADDSEDAVKVRLSIYHEKTEPLINFYAEKGMLVNINGEQEIADIAKDVLSAVKKVM
ncbi:MAG: adenylate kinase [Candidatus Midichloriaceae bacterium]|jgi:adenylate kinase|nr:adenylate kinase [Candidatus Midichloriaceae bacterium]